MSVRVLQEFDSARADSVCLLKYLLRPSRSCNRPRQSRAFTAVLTHVQHFCCLLYAELLNIPQHKDRPQDRRQLFQGLD